MAQYKCQHTLQVSEHRCSVPFETHHHPQYLHPGWADVRAPAGILSPAPEDSISNSARYLTLDNTIMPFIALICAANGLRNKVYVSP